MNRFSYSLFVLCGIIFFHQQGYAAIAIEPVQLYLSDQAKQRSTTLTFDSKREKYHEILKLKQLSGLKMNKVRISMRLILVL